MTARSSMSKRSPGAIAVEPREQRVQRLRGLVERGLASGPGKPDTVEDLAELQLIAFGEVEQDLAANNRMKARLA